ncbi:MAG: hypothetical protein ABFQ95_05400 [Pseudomonadota bacterium]
MPIELQQHPPSNSFQTLLKLETLRAGLIYRELYDTMRREIPIKP